MPLNAEAESLKTSIYRFISKGGFLFAAREIVDLDRKHGYDEDVRSIVAKIKSDFAEALWSAKKTAIWNNIYHADDKESAKKELHDTKMLLDMLDLPMPSDFLTYKGMCN